MRTIVILWAAVILNGQVLQRFEIRTPEGSATGKLVAFIDDREVNLSNDALRAWKGWRPDIVLYTERLPDGREQLRAFNAITGARNAITTESLSIRDVSAVRLDNGEFALVLFMRDSTGRTPWLGLAHFRTGVFKRIPNATAGAILDDRVVVKIFDGREIDANFDDLQKTPATRTEVLSLRPPM